MIIGVPKEIKTHENRVALVPAGVVELVRHGHTVLVEKGAGLGSSFPDSAYVDAGATIVDDVKDIWAKAEMIMKVKEPIAREYPLMREGQILFTYFHFAAEQKLTEAVMASKCIAIAYETVEKADRSLPLLIPMSEVAGRMSVQEGAKYLEKAQGGRGVLLGGIPGVPPANVLVLGGGIVGVNAAKIAAGMGANVFIMDVNLNRLRYLDDIMPKNVTTVFSSAGNIREYIKTMDLVIGAVLIPGAKAPHLITRDMLKTMMPGSVIVDVAIDQGGCIETAKPTTHDDPIYVVDEVLRGQHARRSAEHVNEGLDQRHASVRHPDRQQRLESGVQREQGAGIGLEHRAGHDRVQRRGRSLRIRFEAGFQRAELIYLTGGWGDGRSFISNTFIRAR